MSKMLIDVDDALLDAARRIFGTATKKDTVKRALQEVVRRDAAAELVRLGGTGVFGTQSETA
jgi:Arc/MetJ family transcription regulator